jgi:hypothetical protein
MLGSPLEGSLRGYARDTLLSNGRYRIEKELNSRWQAGCGGTYLAALLVTLLRYHDVLLTPPCAAEAVACSLSQTIMPSKVDMRALCAVCPCAGGATAIVYAAEDLQLHTYVALKVRRGDRLRLPHAASLARLELSRTSAWSCCAALCGAAPGFLLLPRARMNTG